MKFYLTDAKKYMSIEMRTWENDQWSPDCFQDMEVNVPSMYQHEDGGDAYLCTSEEFRQIVASWEEECRRMREGEIGELTFGDEYTPSSTHLFAEEIA